MGRSRNLPVSLCALTFPFIQAILFSTMKLIVRVPATTANLGPGFDSLGLALDIWNTITVRESTGGDQVEWRECPPAQRVDPASFDREHLPAPRDNLVLSAMEIAFTQAKAKLPNFQVTITNCIPIGRGLGSSAAAIIGGLVVANTWSGSTLSSDQLLALATEIEGHPDNVSAALVGGLTISVVDELRIITQRLTPPRAWRAVLFVPAERLTTRVARAVLPRRVSRADAIFNISRAALLVHAFATANPRALDVATRDALHQPYRERLIPFMPELFAAARQAGACGVALSGAGPTLVAFVENENKAEQVRAAFAQRAQALSVAGAACVTGLSGRGAHTRWMK